MSPTPAKVAAASAVVLLALCAAGRVAADSAAPLPPEANIVQLQAALMTHRTTVVAVTQYYLRRIDALDSHGPALHSIIQVNPEAATLAAQLDSAPAGNGILFGVPVVLKDNIETADGMLTTAGP